MCLIGSANVTHTALGWRTPSNLELLTPVARTADHIVEFEEALFAGAVRATAVQRDRLEELLERFHGLPAVMVETENNEMAMGLLPPTWVPRVRNPDELYSVYRGNSDVSRSALRLMQEDSHRSVSFPEWTKKSSEYGLPLQSPRPLSLNE